MPELRSNLLSCLYLTRAKGFKVIIHSHHMEFVRSEKTLFTATINGKYAAYLDGETEVSASEFAHIASTLPLDYNLWHRCLAHHNYADIDRMLNDSLVTGMQLTSPAKPDPVCEPCKC